MPYARVMPAKKQNCTLCDFVGRDRTDLDAHLNSTHKDFLITLFLQQMQAALHLKRLGGVTPFRHATAVSGS